MFFCARLVAEGLLPTVAPFLMQPARARDTYAPSETATSDRTMADLIARDYLAAAGNAGSLPISRVSCWMMTLGTPFES